MALSVVNRLNSELSHTNMLIMLAMQEVDSKSQNNLQVYILALLSFIHPGNIIKALLL